MPRRLKILIVAGSPFLIAAVPMLAFVPLTGGLSSTMELEQPTVVQIVDGPAPSEPVAFSVDDDCRRDDGGHAEG